MKKKTTKARTFTESRPAAATTTSSTSVTESSKTTLDFLKESLETENSKEKPSDSNADDSSGVDSVEPVNFDNLEEGGRSVTYEGLRQRLHKKIEEVRAGRGSGRCEEDEKGENKEKREGKKRKRSGESGKKMEEYNESEKMEKKRAIEKEVSEAAETIQFGKVKLYA
ncbi:hypothetical protein Nepgr_009741 [Nepenthes gracilis]|uniref:Uncharacterized protein n=1 Tax=Nepenthes gracilis TaxID=150966 RepID=A0AAD3SBP8_NEPGR|nr:hypothetical protein Nepgr_009741 [Nepenthes gracilis]